jgi:hypothetical protein
MIGNKLLGITTCVILISHRNRGEQTMAAQSVTGKGLGSADKRQKGSEHARLGSEKIIGPRCVAVGSVTLDGSGDGVVKLPALTGVTANYLVFANSQTTSSATAVGCSLAISGSTTTLTIKGTANHVISYSIQRVGLAV